MNEIIYSLFSFALLSFFFLFIARKKGFFSLPLADDWIFPIRWYHVIVIFFLYFFVAAVWVPLIIQMLRSFGIHLHTVQAAALLNFISSLSILVLISIYLKWMQKDVVQSLWNLKKSKKWLNDCQFGALCWVVSFPFVIFSNQFFDWLLHDVFQLPHIPEQLAVRFLKMTFHYPLEFFLTVITIVLFAPIIEEILFRGFLQSFIRQHLGSRSAIFISSFCFAFFHYSPEQGISNISIISSLFFLALFLGYSYETRRSLIAPISLHALFNMVNVANLYFLGGFPKGPYI